LAAEDPHTIPKTLQKLSVEIDSVEPYDRNPREGDIGAISESLLMHGQYRPIVVNKPTRQILAGNHTWKAAKALGWTEIAVSFVDVDDEQAARIVLVDNRTNDLASYDDAMLAGMLEELQASSDLTGTGYDTAALDELLADLQPLEFKRGREGDVAEPPEEPVTKPGDVWQLGEHRLVCGDATQSEEWQLDEPFDLLWTDPPYGVSYADKNAFLNAADKGNSIQTPIRLDHQTPEEMAALWLAAFTAARTHAADHATYYTTGPQGGELALLLMTAIRDAGWQLKHTLIWAKNVHVLGRLDYNYQHEPVLYGWNKKHKWHGGFATSLLHHPKPAKSDLHPTMKPVTLIEDCIDNSTGISGLVADMFAGSGSTLMAAENTGRRCHAVEIDPGYCDVIVERFRSINPDAPIKREHP